MKRRFFGMTAMLCAGIALAGCGKPEVKPAAKPAAPGQAQTVYGAAVERSRATECFARLRETGRYLLMGGDYLPASRNALVDSGCPEALLGCPDGKQYEFLVKGRVRNAGKTPVLRCPTHDFTLFSDGDVVQSK